MWKISCLQASGEKYILIHMLAKEKLQQLREVAREEVKTETQIERVEQKIEAVGKKITNWKRKY